MFLYIKFPLHHMSLLIVDRNLNVRYRVTGNSGCESVTPAERERHGFLQGERSKSPAKSLFERKINWPFS